MKFLIFTAIATIMAFSPPCLLADNSGSNEVTDHKGQAIFQQGVNDYTGCSDSIKNNVALYFNKGTSLIKFPARDDIDSFRGCMSVPTY